MMHTCTYKHAYDRWKTSNVLNALVIIGTQDMQWS